MQIFVILIISVAVPVHFFSDPKPRIRFFKIRIIRIRVTQKRQDPTGSGYGSGFYLDMFLMFSKINIFMSFSHQIKTSYDTLDQR